MPAFSRSQAAVFAFACLLGSVSAARFGARPADPFADPKNDPYNPLRYIASNTLTSIGLALFLVTDLALFFNTWKWGAKYMLSIPIGGATYCLGLAMRYGLHVKPESKGIYIAEYLFVVLSPCAFIAGVYVLLGRLVRFLRTDKYLLVPPHKVTIIFVASDVVTFLIQAAGGGASTSLDMKSRDTGRKIFLVGLALQLASFFFFTTLLFSWGFKVHKHERAIWTQDSGKRWMHDWRTLYYAIILSCCGILVRSFFRVIEISEGFQGHLATTELYFYVLDALPLLIAIAVYIPLWPGRFITSQPADIESVEKSSQDETATPDIARTLHDGKNSVDVPRQEDGDLVRDKD